MNNSGKKWHMVIDIARCHDCNDCFLADKDEFVGNDFPPYSVAQPWTGHRWLNIERKERGQYPIVQTAYLPLLCMHCDAAPCLTPDGAVYKRDDGIVIIDPVKAKGRRNIVDSCPYGVIYWNEEAQVAQKCTGCVHLLEDGWTETRCSQVCPTGAIQMVLGADSEMERLAAAEELQIFRPELGTEPRVYFKNLHRWTAAFAAGSVVFADTDECAEGAEVTVLAGGVLAGNGRVNNYGEFIVDGLGAGEKYVVSVRAPGYVTTAQTVLLEKSLNLGTIMLEPEGGEGG
jgi:Fe-S-cluster-containing dehydrogenase component